jgi:outer membrane protein assembly factor BamB
MTHSADHAKSGDALARARYQAALGTAMVSGALVLIVCAFLATAHIRTMTLDFHKSEELTALRAELLKASDPASPGRSPATPGRSPAAATALKQKIDARDFELREDFFRRESLAKTGGYLLVGGLLVFIIAANRVVAWRKRRPVRRSPIEPDTEGRAVRRASWAVIGTGAAVVAAAAILLAWAGHTPLSESAPTETAAAGPTAVFPSDEEIAREWPRFRGPGGLGVSAYANVPTSWNGKTGDGIAWKAAVPLAGAGSPIVWGNRIFLTGADARRREVYCYQASDGKLLWQKPVVMPAGAAEPPEVSQDTGYAASTGTTDGQRVYAIFASGDLACFDFAGQPVWARNVGPLSNTYGHASSLATYRNLLIVQLDQGEPGKTLSVIRGLDALTGKPVWETSRPVPSSWATPIVVRAAGRDLCVTSAKPWVIAYDPATGTELWRAKGLDGDVAPSPTFGGGLVLAACATSKLLAIRPDGQPSRLGRAVPGGDVAATRVAWTAEDGLPDIPSPVASDRLVWLVNSSGMLTAYRLKDGSKAYEKELETNVRSSPSLAGDRLYVTSDKGVTLILASGEEFKELGRNELGERVDASPAFQDGRIYLRGKAHLFAIGRK